MAHVTRIAVLLLLVTIALPVNAQKLAVVDHDADWAATQQILQSQGYSLGEDGLVHYVQVQPEITGYKWLDDSLRFVWNNCGKLMILFGLIAVVFMFRDKLNGGETYGEYLRRQAADRWAEEQGEDIHNPFDSPEGMQPASQYVGVRTRR